MMGQWGATAWQGTGLAAPTSTRSPHPNVKEPSPGGSGGSEAIPKAGGGGGAAAPPPPQSATTAAAKSIQGRPGQAEVPSTDFFEKIYRSAP